MSDLHIQTNNGFLYMEDLPQNCIFNKVVTGCGGTTIALFNKINYIIAVPTTELITSKTGLSEAGTAIITSPDNSITQQVFGLFGAFKHDVKFLLKNYIATEGVKKILCTYDKVKYLQDYINPQQYQILVDEYHQLLKACKSNEESIVLLEDFYQFFACKGANKDSSFIEVCDFIGRKLL